MGTLPVANNPEVSRSLIERDRDTILNALRTLPDVTSGTVRMQAYFPETVGTIPETERDIFDSCEATHPGTMYNWDKFPDELVATKALVLDDLGRLGMPITKFRQSMFQILHGDLGTTKHVDVTASEARHAGGVLYIVANRNSALVYEGQGWLGWKRGVRSSELCLKGNFESTAVAAADDYQITRLTLASVHESDPPKADQPHKDRVSARVAFLY